MALHPFRSKRPYAPDGMKRFFNPFQSYSRHDEFSRREKAELGEDCKIEETIPIQNRLPLEVLQIIISYLCMDDLVSLAGSCRFFRNEVKGHLARIGYPGVVLDMRVETLATAHPQCQRFLNHSHLWNARNMLIKYIRMIRFVGVVHDFITESERFANLPFAQQLTSAPETCYVLFVFRQELVNPLICLQRIPMSWVLSNLLPREFPRHIFSEQIMQSHHDHLIEIRGDTTYKSPLSTYAWPNLERISLYIGAQSFPNEVPTCELKTIERKILDIFFNAPKLTNFSLTVYSLSALHFAILGPYIRGLKIIH